MKKTILFASLMLAALSFVACKKSEPTDLRLIDLQGNVESVKTQVTWNVNAKGKKTRKSWKSEGPTYYFNQEGFLTRCSEMNQEVVISRDKKENIIQLDLPCENADGSWNDGGYTIEFTWSSEGFVTSKQYDNCIGSHCQSGFLYNDSNILIGCLNEWAAEGEMWQTDDSYTILNTDSRGNWIKRLIKTTEWGDLGDISYKLEERVITYYDEDVPQIALVSSNEREHDDNSTRQYNSSNTNQSITKTVFRHESDVHKYLRNHEFTDANGDITISESYNMSLKFNGRELTGAIVITEFNSCAAYFTAHSPISGLTYQFIVNCEQGVLYCVSDGTTYYAR